LRLVKAMLLDRRMRPADTDVFADVLVDPMAAGAIVIDGLFDEIDRALTSEPCHEVLRALKDKVPAKMTKDEKRQ